MGVKAKVISAIIFSVIGLGAVATVVYVWHMQNQVPEPTTPVPETTTVDPHAGKVQNYLNGKWQDPKVNKKRPIAVMYNNIEAAIPHYGISYADVNYEIPVEGTITRIMAIFQNYHSLKRMGSVRSCRIYFARASLEWDSIYVHYGQSKYAKKFLRSKKIDNVCAYNAGNYFYRTNDKPAPHNCYTSGKLINKAVKKLRYKWKHKMKYKGTVKFVEDGKAKLPDSKEALTVKTGYTYNHAYYKYNKKNGQYYRYQYGKKHIDKKNNSQLHCSNIIFQFVKWKIFPDHKSLNIKQTGKGKGWFITNGKATKITWEKKRKNGITHYYYPNGEEIKLNTGKTWINLIHNKDKKDVKIIGSKKKKSKKQKETEKI